MMGASYGRRGTPERVLLRLCGPKMMGASYGRRGTPERVLLRLCGPKMMGASYGRRGTPERVLLRLCGPQTMTATLRQVRIFYLYAFALTWGVGLVGLLAPRIFPGARAFSGSSPFYTLAAYSVSLTGIALTAFYDRGAGLRRLFQRLLPWRSGPQWYLIVIGGYGLLTLAAWYAARLSGATTVPLPGPRAALFGLALTLVYDVGPVGEEFGWRGFALPRLLEVRRPLAAGLILGLVHTLWHVPLFFIPGMSQRLLSFPAFMVGVLSLSIINLWLYLRTGANLLLAILVHLMGNYCTGILGAPLYPFLAAGEAAAAIAIIAFGGLRPPKQSPKP
jgi:hypothetical protein